MIKVIVADDHALVRDGLKLLIDGQPDMRVVAEVGDGRQVIRSLQTSSCDVLILDLVMPGGGLQVLRHIRQKALDVRTLVLTMHAKPTYVRQAMAAGADGYLVKSAAASELLDAIRRVHKGQIYTHGAVKVTADKTRAAVRRPRIRFSGRERQVLRLIAEGWTNSQIAKNWGLSVKTVEGYRARVYGKIGAHNRADLVRYAIEHGLI